MGCSFYNSTCALCYDNSSRVARVCIQDNFHLLKQLHEFKSIFKRYNPYSFLLLCEVCLMKLRIFIKCDKVFIPNTFQRMQDSSKPKKENVPHIEDTNCQCEHCIAKFGNLPLLAEVIENIEKKSSSPERASPYEDENKSASTVCDQEKIVAKDSASSSGVQTPEILPQPSTSKDIVGAKKIMNCEHCGKGFTHKGDLNKHLRKHTGEQPFQCPVCERKFAHTSNLARHLKVHSGDKPFHCERCNKSFSRKDKLILHQKTKLCMNAAHSSRS